MVEVKQSTLPDAGLGLFATQPFRKHQLITRYSGEVLGNDEAKKRRECGKGDHLRSLASQHLVIDGLFDPFDPKHKDWGLASFANDPRIQILENKTKGSKKRFVIQKGKGKVCNSKFYTKIDLRYLRKDSPCLETCFLKATRDIEIGEEIFVSYGNTYWRSK